MHLTSLSRAGIYRLLKESRVTGQLLFPMPRQVGKGRIGWLEHEIEEWIATRPPTGIDGILSDDDSEK